MATRNQADEFTGSWGINCSCTCTGLVETVKRLAATPYRPMLQSTHFFAYAFQSGDTLRTNSQLALAQVVVDNLRRFGRIFFMGCGATPTPSNATILPCPRHLEVRASCFSLHTERIRLAMLQVAAARGIADAIFVELDQLWLSDPRVLFAGAIKQGAQVGVKCIASAQAERNRALAINVSRSRALQRELPETLNSGVLYTQTGYRTRAFWLRVINKTEELLNYSGMNQSCVGGENQMAMMSLLMETGRGVKFGPNSVRVHPGKSNLKVHVGHYYIHVREPWLARKDTRGRDIMASSINKSGTGTPCLSTLLLDNVTRWGKRFGSAQPPRFLHYKGWHTCPSPAAARNSFMSTAACIQAAAASTDILDSASTCSSP